MRSISSASDVSVICVCLHGGDSLQTYGLGGEMKGLS